MMVHSGTTKRVSLAMIAAGLCIALAGLLKGGFGIHETRIGHSLVVGGGLTLFSGAVLRFVDDLLQPFS